MKTKGKYFTLDELIYSQTAKEQKIENIPPDEIAEHIVYDLIPALDDIREKWGSPIVVSSGYRCPTLNKVVGGVANSVHKLGWAADLVPKNGKIDEFENFMNKWAEDNQFDQIIEEKSKSSRWVHFGLFSNSGAQRRQAFKLIK